VPLRLVHAYRLGGTPYAEVLERVDPLLRQHADQMLGGAIAAELEGVVDVDATTEAIADTPARALLGESAAAQLVVVGARGHGGFGELLLGSTSHQCVLHAACPVAVVRA
jgi:nucleotide-binding universal stress UspA family protein